LFLYVTFITACGWTHFMDAMMFFQPAYRINGLVRCLTAIVSFMTAVSLLRLIPQAITAPITIITQQAALKQQHQWLRDILDAATGGVLHLCESSAELPPPAASTGQSVAVHVASDLRSVRQMTERISQAVGLSPTQTEDFTCACHEATMNALVHAQGATVNGYIDYAHGRAQVWVEDTGSGIPLDRLPISTLKQGYSTAGTAGQGWFLVLTMVDRAYLLTGRGGTRLVLEVSREPSRPSAIPFSHSVGGDVAPHLGLS
jgi:anti-sigma regulatory factor (Ser/Thr protein kinase)